MIRLTNNLFGVSCSRCLKESVKRSVGQSSWGGRFASLSTLSNVSPKCNPHLRSSFCIANNVAAFGRFVTPSSRTYSQLSGRLACRLRLLQARPPTHSSPRAMSLLGRTAARLIRFRYILLTTGVGGGVVAHQKYESWKDSLPDFRAMLPDSEQLDALSKELRRLRKNLMRLPEFPVPKKEFFSGMSIPSIADIRQYLDGVAAKDPSIFDEVPDAGSTTMNATGPMPAFSFQATAAASDTETKTRLEELQDEVVRERIRYQKEIERLEKENRELRKTLLLRDHKSGKPQRKMKKALIDMYSEVLDELANYDCSYRTADHLPRVVVVGDQSAGKTSVLEMIAQARIFPRGSGEMMTRAPVKVTLSEGPYHVARFKDDPREYDLTKEADLQLLRKEVELRMKASVTGGQTISAETIAMTVKGPGLPRMVLVDLPGVISTVTSGMASDTRDRIQQLCRQHMENPNAIILCIQDGSLDAERSNVTDLVSSMDPQGRRTIFVLTKVDLAERDLINPQRIQQILDGKLFPMKALGYFAVVTGRGNVNESIASIKEYEDQFFRGSKLFREGILKPSQMTTHNLSLAVSDRFWRMVRESVEQQADAFRATRFNLETEWKNTFPRVRELDREELFEKARGDILDEIISLSHVTAQEWEEAFRRKLWDKTAAHVFERIYLPASQHTNPGSFNTAIDISLRDWTDRKLPAKCVEVGKETLQEKFAALLQHDQHNKDRDGIFDELKAAIFAESTAKHTWDPKAETSLRVIQNNTLDDRSVHTKQQWDSAIAFMETAVKAELAKNDAEISNLKGPSTSEQWLYWRSKTGEQQQRAAVMGELQKLCDIPLGAENGRSGGSGRRQHPPDLSPDEVTTVRKNLEAKNVEVTPQFIRETWQPVYRRQFLRRALSKACDCKKGFHYYQHGFNEPGLECHDVVLFWRIQRTLEVTSNALRQQVVNNEARRLERNIKGILNETGENRERLEKLLTGRRVQLAEELKRVRQIHDLLEEFVTSLHKEKA